MLRLQSLNDVLWSGPVPSRRAAPDSLHSGLGLLPLGRAFPPLVCCACVRQERMNSQHSARTCHRVAGRSCHCNCCVFLSLACASCSEYHGSRRERSQLKRGRDCLEAGFAHLHFASTFKSLVILWSFHSVQLRTQMDIVQRVEAFGHRQGDGSKSCVKGR